MKIWSIFSRKKKVEEKHTYELDPKSRIGKKAPLELMCLSLLKEKDMTGIEISEEIKSRSGGLLDFYWCYSLSVLYHLREAGVISMYEVEREGKRPLPYYHLEPKGEEYLLKFLAEYTLLQEGVQTFLETIN